MLTESFTSMGFDDQRRFVAIAKKVVVKRHIHQGTVRVGQKNYKEWVKEVNGEGFSVIMLRVD